MWKKIKISDIASLEKNDILCSIIAGNKIEFRIVANTAEYLELLSLKFDFIKILPLKKLEIERWYKK